MTERQGQIIVGIAVLALVAFVATSIVAMAKLERITQSVERIDGRVEAAFKAGAPLGREIVDKGVETVKGVDGKKVAEKATVAAEEVTDALKEYLKRKLEKELQKDKPNPEPEVPEQDAPMEN